MFNVTLHTQNRAAVTRSEVVVVIPDPASADEQSLGRPGKKLARSEITRTEARDDHSITTRQTCK